MGKMEREGEEWRDVGGGRGEGSVRSETFHQ